MTTVNIAHQTSAKCPSCQQEDYCEFAFVGHNNTEVYSFLNPSDFHRLYICPNLHIYAFNAKGECEVIKSPLL